jgi:hypothetical protein
MGKRNIKRTREGEEEVNVDKEKMVRMKEDKERNIIIYLIFIWLFICFIHKTIRLQKQKPNYKTETHRSIKQTSS